MEVENPNSYRRADGKKCKGEIKMKRFEYESYTEWYGGKYSTFTKVFDWEKADSTWRGCHWDNPAIIKAEVVEGGDNV